MALVYCFYGYFDDANRVIEEIDWPLVQATEKIIRCLVNYLSLRDYEEGLRLAKNAVELFECDRRFPGAKTAKDSGMNYVEIGEILNGTFSCESVQLFEV